MTPLTLPCLLVLFLSIPAHAQEEPSYAGADAATWARRFVGKTREARAWRRLGDGGPEALPVLRVLLRSKEPEIAGYAARALAVMGPDAAPALPDLVFALKDGPKPYDRLQAATTIGKLGAAGYAAIPDLASALGADADASPRSAAAAALARLAEGAGKTAILALERALADGNPLVRSGSARALGEIGVHREVPAASLLAMLDDEESGPRRAAARALWRLGPEAIDQVVAALRKGASATAVVALSAGGFDAVPLLGKLLEDEDPIVVAAAREALVQVGWPALPLLSSRSEDELVRRIFEEGMHAQLNLAEHQVLYLDPPLDEHLGDLQVHWESGSGHGGSFAMTHLHSEGGNLQGQRLRYARERWGPHEEVVAEEIRIPQHVSRAALLALLHIAGLRLERRPDANGAGGGWGSTADFHAAIRLANPRVVLCEQRFAGYPGSRKIGSYFQARLADRILREAVAAGEVRTRSPSAGDRSDLLARLEGYANDAWWVQERILRTIGFIGDARFVPFLREQIATPAGTHARRMRYAIDAYAQIAGPDLRPDTFDDKHVREVRERYLELWRR